jgi:Protein of unknown function (DUF2587)
MNGRDAASGLQGENDLPAPVRRFAVVVGEGADRDGAYRIDAPDRLLRVRSLLNGTYEQIDRAGLPQEGIPRLQRQLQAIRRELEDTVSPPLVAELRRILPPQDEAASAGALRIECTALLSWADSLTMQMLSTLHAARERQAQPPAAA